MNNNILTISDEWVTNYVGDFLILIYHEGLVKSFDWQITKSLVRSKFEDYLEKTSKAAAEKCPELKLKIDELKRSFCIGTLLQKTGFLKHTPRGSPVYEIYYKKFFSYRVEKIKEFDEIQKRTGLLDSILSPNSNQDECENNLKNYECIPEGPKHFLLYRATGIRIRNSVETSNTGCYICRKDFTNFDEYEEHISYHNDNSDFQCLNEMEVREPSFEIFYQLCLKSHIFCFTFELKNVEQTSANLSANTIVVEKILIVQSRSFVNVHNDQMPFEMEKNDAEAIYLSSNLLNQSVEQPIIIAYYIKGMPEIQYVEQHHFFRNESFPIATLALSPTRLPNKSLFKPKRKVPLYSLSQREMKEFQSKTIVKYFADQSKLFQTYIDEKLVLTSTNFPTVFNCLLKIEDLEEHFNYSRLNQTQVKLQEYESTYIMTLKLSNKNVNLPSISDTIKLKPNDKDEKKYEGFITNVSGKSITFKCNKRITLQGTFDAKFHPNRSQRCYQYDALSNYHTCFSKIGMARFLFPKDIKPLTEEEKSEIVNMKLNLNKKSIGENPEQLLAVKNIVWGPRKEAPFIIFGPPGTGKTTTLVEAIYQLFITKPETKILIVAGSNSACDEIALRLCKLIIPLNCARSIVRLYSSSYEDRIDFIDDLLLEHSNMYNGQFLPEVKILHEFRIVVCTLGLLGRLITGGFGKTALQTPVFTHIVIDEAATLTEPETLIPITFCASADTRLILAGDHKQLNAVLYSKIAAELGLNISLMERLTNRECYHRTEMNCYDTSIQIHLIRNYRSHPKLVHLFSEMFYNNRLVPMMTSENQECFYVSQNWYRSPNKEFPIVFHSVFGQATQSKNSPSYYNRDELMTVLSYIKDLLFFGVNGEKVYEKDIGVISPYKSQSSVIKEQLNLRKWTEIEVGTVETFQGREKNFIIVSFVRSFDNSLGFLDNPKRLCVTISRAKAYLILIGHPKTLSLSEDFMKIMKSCEENGTFLGDKFNLDIKEAIPSSYRKHQHQHYYQHQHKRHRRRNYKNDFNSDNESEISSVASTINVDSILAIPKSKIYHCPDVTKTDVLNKIKSLKITKTLPNFNFSDDENDPHIANYNDGYEQLKPKIIMNDDDCKLPNGHQSESEKFAYSKEDLKDMRPEQSDPLSSSQSSLRKYNILKSTSSKDLADLPRKPSENPHNLTSAENIIKKANTVSVSGNHPLTNSHSTKVTDWLNSLASPPAASSSSSSIYPKINDFNQVSNEKSNIQSAGGNYLRKDLGNEENSIQITRGSHYALSKNMNIFNSTNNTSPMNFSYSSNHFSPPNAFNSQIYENHPIPPPTEEKNSKMKNRQKSECLLF